MKAKIYSFLTIILAISVLFSCKKEEDLPPQSAAQFGADKTTAMVGEVIQFTNSSENATAFKWSFGDGTTSKEVSPKKSYQNTGVYNVSLVSTGAGGSTIQNLVITIVPAASFTVEDEENLFASVPVQFTNTSNGATSFSWDFGDADGSTSTEENPAFTYDDDGTYTVTLTAISDEGESTFSKEITIGAATDVDELYFIEYGAGFIAKLLLDGSGTVANVLDMTGMTGVGMAYDEVNEKVYFSDFEVIPEGKIWRMNTDGSELEALVTDIHDPYAIALDVPGGKMYWVDEDGNVSRANLDGSSPEIGIVNIEGGQMRAIDLDVENNKMYFYEVFNEDLYVADLDGSNVSVIVPGVYGYAILVDTENDKIYFDDQNSATLSRANLDGSGMETINDNGTRIYGMDIDYEEGKIYWSGRDSGEISRANLDGSNTEVLKSGLNSPRGLFLRN